MAAASGTLYQKGLGLDKASQMVVLLEPFAGRFAVSIFMTGIVAAGVSSQFPNVLLLPWLLCDYQQSNRDMKQPKYRIIVLILSLLGLIVPVFHVHPLIVMIASQAFGALILPMTAIFIFYLGNKKTIMKDYQYSWFLNVVLVCIIFFAMFMGGSGILGLIGAL
jgi:Mn2+/Fe2+ NRAMP family transporter